VVQPSQNLQWHEIKWLGEVHLIGVGYSPV
jgi:hypothetical protein